MAVDSVPSNVTPRAPATSGFKVPAIPNPGRTPEELMATIRALKEAVELLSGQRGNNRALTAADMGLHTPTGTANDPNTNTIDNPGGYGLLDEALKEFQGIFSTDLNAINTQLTNDIAAAIAGYIAGDETISLELDVLSEELDDTAAAVTTESIARADGDVALAAQITTVSAVAGGKNKVFVSDTEPVATAIGDIWIDTLHNNLLKTWDGLVWEARQDGDIAATAAAVQNEIIARADADSTITAAISTHTSQINTNAANITSEAATRATADSALSLTLTNLTTTVGNQAAALTTEAATRATVDSALSGQITTAQTTANNATASGSYRLLSTTTQQGAAAEFAVQITTNSGTNWYNAGMRLQAFGAGGGGSSRVIFDAAQFIVDTSSGTGGTGVAVFNITGSNIEWNGTLKVNAITAGSGIIGTGVITTAMIQNAQITNALIGSAAITSAKIQDLEVGTLKITGQAVTTNAVATSSTTVIGNSTTQTILTLPFSTVIPIGVTADVVVTATWVNGYAGTPGVNAMTITLNGGGLTGLDTAGSPSIYGTLRTSYSVAGTGTAYNPTFALTWFAPNIVSVFGPRVLTVQVFKR